MSGRALRRAWALAPVAAGLVALPAAAQAQFPLPSICNGQATGVTDVGGAGEPPVVTVSYTIGSGIGYVEDAAIGTFNDAPAVGFTAPTSVRADNFLLVVTYTPFLQSYQAISPRPSGATIVPLPQPGWFSDPRYRLIGQLALTVRMQNGTPLPLALIEIAPEFPGSSPYTMQADQNGMLAIYCFTYRPEISVTGYDASGTLYQGTIQLDQIAAPVVAQASGSAVMIPVD